MSKLYTTQFKLIFYPLPPLSKVEQGVMYEPHPLFAQYFSTYSRVIDKDYYLALYERRYEQPPNQSILNIWGDDEDMKEWAAISSIMDERLAGVVMRMFMYGCEPYYLDDYIRAQRPYFGYITKLQKISPFADVMLEPNYFLNKGNLELLLHITKNSQHFLWDWEAIVRQTIELMPLNGHLTIASYDNISRIVSLLIDYKFVEIQDGIWEKQSVPTRTHYFNSII